MVTNLWKQRYEELMVENAEVRDKVKVMEFLSSSDEREVQEATQNRQILELEQKNLKLRNNLVLTEELYSKSVLDRQIESVRNEKNMAILQANMNEKQV